MRRDLSRSLASTAVSALAITGLGVLGASPASAVDPDVLLLAPYNAGHDASTLYDGDGMSHKEIAALLGAPEGTVRSEVFHGRRALREQLATFREELGDVGQSI